VVLCDYPRLFPRLTWGQRLALLIRLAAISTWRHPSTPTTLLWRPMMLVYATWPVYTLAWLLALLRVPLGYRLTPKGRSGRLHPAWILPQLMGILLLGIGIAFSLGFSAEPRPPILFGFAAIQSSPLIVFLGGALGEALALRSSELPMKA
jgi:hypothetical protein